MRADQDDINDCMDAGICHICRKPVLEGQPRYTPTGAHYECHGNPVKDAYEALDDVEKKLEQMRKLLGG